MSKRELGRIEVLARVRSKQLQVVDAGRLMRVSYRQAKRLWKRYREEGAKGLKHRSAGRPSHRAHEPKFRRKVLQLVRKKYGGLVGERFGPTLAAEHLESEDRLKVDAETLRRWMLAEGLWSRERKRRTHRRRRERKEHFGELVQMDGSFHAWLEERGPEGCLIDMIDDATNTTWAQLGEQETIWAVADTLRVWIERNGVPLALYVDWKNLYKRPATPGERLRGEEPITQFGRMCAKLDIEVIAASSPQAKGRVERVHGTHQDRLVKKLRRKEISSHEHANVYLERDYLPEHNRRFARAAASPEDYHRRAPRAAELDQVFRLESERTISEDWWCATTTDFFSSSRRVAITRQLRGKYWCAKGGTATSPSSIEAARCGEGDSGTPQAEWGGQAGQSASSADGQKEAVPPANHPWREATRRAMEKRVSKEAVATRPLLAWPSAAP